MKQLCLLMTILFSFVFTLLSFGQITADERKPYNDAIQLYHQFLNPETGLYNGMEYIDYAYSVQDGTPFFGQTPFDDGSVVFKNILYENVPLAYDIVKNTVVIYDATRILKLILANKEVSSFTASGAKFVHLTKDSAAAPLSDGYYEVLYDGKTRVLKKAMRSVQESLSTGGSSKRYIVGSADYFIKKNNTYHTVNNKAALLNLLHDKEKEVKQTLRKKRLKFNRNKDDAIIQAAAYYDTTIH